MRVRFTKFGSNSQVGGFGPGDFANVSDALANHLVDEAGVAKYDQGDQTKAPEPKTKPAAAPAARGRRKA